MATIKKNWKKIKQLQKNINDISLGLCGVYLFVKGI